MLRRREFLRRGSLAAVGACLFPTIVPRRVFGQSPNSAPSERIGLGLIGMGKQMTMHREGLVHRDDVQIIGVCDVDRFRRELAKSEIEQAYAAETGKSAYRGVAAVEDFRELLAMPEVDAVVIATPDHWHSIIAVEAIRAGKDVYCEKPLAITVREGRAICDAVEQYACVFQVGSQQRSERAFRVAAQLACSGYLGDLKEIWVDVPQTPAMPYNVAAEPVPDGLNWDFWLGPSQVVPYSAELEPAGDMRGHDYPHWRDYIGFAGGRVTDWTPHHPNIAQWALGFDGSGPEWILPPGGDVAELTWIWPGGLPMKCGMPYAGGMIAFVGTEGVAIAARGDLLETRPGHLKELRFRPTEDLLPVSTNHFSDWFDCIRTRRQPICSVEAGHRSATLGLLADLAMRFEKPIHWDAASELIIDDPALLPLLGREMRAPWSLI